VKRGLKASVAFMCSLEALSGRLVSGVDGGAEAVSHGSGGGEDVKWCVGVVGEA